MKKKKTSGICVSDYMSKSDIAFDVRDDVADIASILLENDLSGAPVVDQEGTVVGFVSEQDCIKEMLNTAWHCEHTATARDIMSKEVLTVTPSLAITDLAEQLSVNRPKSYPVVANGQLLGTIHRADILRALVEKSANCHHAGTMIETA